MELRIQGSNTLFSLRVILPLVILFEGFVSIAIEILTIRQLLPFAGGSVVVTSLIIGVFLLFLSLGYQRGGKEKQNAERVLRLNFYIAAVWLGIGLSYIFIELFFTSIQKLLGTHILYPLLGYLLVVIAPLIYILGQTLPMTMNLIKQNRPAGSIGGDLLSLSTLGSFLGATATTLFFMYYVGCAFTLFINVMLLLFLSMIFAESKKDLLISILVSLVTAFFIYDININIEKSYFSLTDSYANYQVLADGEHKTLVINNGLSSSIDQSNKGFAYVELIKKIIFHDMQLKDAEILVLGAGGFTISADGDHDNHFTYIDIDKNIKKVVVPKFIPHLYSHFLVDDARHFLHTSTKQYDVIISDAYSDIKAIPAHLLTKEYMQAIQNRLKDAGAAIFNVVANPTLADRYSKRVDNTIRSIFANCMVQPINYNDHITNIIYTCQKRAPHEVGIYTDNLNNSTTDAFTWA